jgi:uncharacterized protein (TIGR04141 family)
VERDDKLETFRVIHWNVEVGKKGKTRQVPVYEPEEEYNKRVATSAGYVLFDQKWHTAGDGTVTKLEMCDLYDAANLRMIHVKRSSRQPNLLFYLFEQGQRAAELWQRDDVRNQFIGQVQSTAGDECAEKLTAAKSGDITIEFAIADHENVQGKYTIPFLAKLSFESKAREIELRGFRCQVRFIPLAKPKSQRRSALVSPDIPPGETDIPPGET